MPKRRVAKVTYPVQPESWATFVREPLEESLSVVDLFCGAGGLAEGFRQAGFSITAGLDSDPDAIATFSRNFPAARPILGDIRAADVRAELAEILPGASVLVGGPPCQAFSQVRNHSRIIDDPRNHLYKEFVAALGVARPLAFVMENVTGIDQMGAREQIVADLCLHGEYEVSPQILDAADFGVPQTRRRLFFIGLRKDLAAAPLELSGSGATDAAELTRVVADGRIRYQIAVCEGLFKRVSGPLADPMDDRVVTAADAISDLSGLPAGNREDHIAYSSLPQPRSAYQRKMRVGGGDLLLNVQVPRINADTAQRLANIPSGGNHRDLPDHLLDRYLSGQRWGQENGSGRLSRKHFYAYRRLHPDIWAWTLNTKADSVYHYDRMRSLSVREFARLQSFPDRFVFVTDERKGLVAGRHDGGPAHSRYRQVGNAVPPLLALAVAKEMHKALAASHRRLSIHARTA